jgi:hypothetical protein
MADDFEQLYEALQLEGADTLLVSQQGSIDERGHIDDLPTRVTGSDQRADRILLDVPDAYTEAAAAALNNERVPPGYRAAVKDYFDSME